MTLREVFKRAKCRELPGAWLCLPSDAPWTPDSEAVFIESESELAQAEARGFKSTLDDATIEQVVDWADRLSGTEDDSARLDVFRYYFRFDAFPDRLGAPDPPPAEEVLRQVDLKFYDSLGQEAPGTRCRKEGCVRGTVKFSVFCRSHHFENVRKRPCPFHH